MLNMEEIKRMQEKQAEIIRMILIEQREEDELMNPMRQALLKIIEEDHYDATNI